MEGAAPRILVVDLQHIPGTGPEGHECMGLLAIITELRGGRRAVERRRIGLRRDSRDRLTGGWEMSLLVDLGFLQLGSLRDYSQRVYPFTSKVHGHKNTGSRLLEEPDHLTVDLPNPQKGFDSVASRDDSRQHRGGILVDLHGLFPEQKELSCWIRPNLAREGASPPGFPSSLKSEEKD